MTENENINALRDLAEQANGMINWEINSDGARKIYETVISTLDLIDRLKAEIEALDFLIKESNKLVERQDKAINRLQADNSSMQSTLAKMSMGVEEAKAEAIKEFAERLKKEKFTHTNFGELVYVEDIDNLVKEMVGDNDV